MQPGKPYDYVIVGAGSAGCVLARRLSEQPDIRVLLLEAGGSDRHPWISIPLGWGKIIEHRLFDWMYFSEPEPALNNRRIECARGKVLGGSSSINALAYVRGNRGDYDRWAAAGLTDWSYAHVLPYFRRQESWAGGADAYRGGEGPVGTQLSRFEDPLVDAYMAAGQALGHPVIEDYNGAQQEGFARGQVTVHNGRRCSAAVAYLRPAQRRPNLTILTGALARRILFDGDRAVGIEYSRNGESFIARAEREVILSGGVFNSPHLLMLSGIGDPEELAPQGIAVKVPLKGVGRNLQDHPAVGLSYARTEPGPFHRNMRADRIAGALAGAYLFGKGFAASIPMGWMGFVKATPEATLPNIQLLFRALPAGAAPYLAPFRPPFADGFMCRAVLLRPESRGVLRLASADPETPLRIYQNLLTVERDWVQLRAGLRLAQALSWQAPVARFVAKELNFGPGTPDDAAIDTHIHNTAITAHHPLGTCKMGVDSDPMAVVDPTLKVRGVRQLRVVDGSVMPDLVGGNINAPIYMIAEKAADLIAGCNPPAPARFLV